MPQHLVDRNPPPRQVGENLAVERGAGRQAARYEVERGPNFFQVEMKTCGPEQRRRGLGGKGYSPCKRVARLVNLPVPVQRIAQLDPPIRSGRIADEELAKVLQSNNRVISALQSLRC